MNCYEDSIINNGSELFGALSGDGFGDLSKYDSVNMGRVRNSGIYLHENGTAGMIQQIDLAI
ncbi:MAG: hypothetical protein WD424_02130 [Paenibacillaceae bacterium]